MDFQPKINSVGHRPAKLMIKPNQALKGHNQQHMATPYEKINYAPLGLGIGIPHFIGRCPTLMITMLSALLLLKLTLIIFA